jgi:hypothetical protein
VLDAKFPASLSCYPSKIVVAASATFVALCVPTFLLFPLQLVPYYPLHGVYPLAGIAVSFTTTFFAHMIFLECIRVLTITIEREYILRRGPNGGRLLLLHWDIRCFILLCCIIVPGIGAIGGKRGNWVDIDWLRGVLVAFPTSANQNRQERTTISPCLIPRWMAAQLG